MSIPRLIKKNNNLLILIHKIIIKAHKQLEKEYMHIFLYSLYILQVSLLIL